MLEIFGGRKEFFQWDINQYLMVDNPDIKEVHFSNVYEKEALVVEVKEGKAAVPNILLQTAMYIHAYAFCGECVQYEASYRVKQRKKPADYVYTETEIKRYEDLEQRIANLEKSGSADIDLSDYYTKEETNKAIEEHIPEVDLSEYATKEELAEATNEGVYELIEKITLEEDALIIRNEEPDGTAYRFESLLLFISTEGEVSPINVYFHSSGTSVALGYINAKSNTDKGYISLLCEPKNGYWLSGWKNGWGTTESGGGIDRFNYHRMRQYPRLEGSGLTQIRMAANNATLPAGTIIEIWGVRANA